MAVRWQSIGCNTLQCRHDDSCYAWLVVRPGLAVGYQAN